MPNSFDVIYIIICLFWFGFFLLLDKYYYSQLQNYCYYYRVHYIHLGIYRQERLWNVFLGLGERGWLLWAARWPSFNSFERRDRRAPFSFSRHQSVTRHVPPALLNRKKRNAKIDCAHDTARHKVPPLSYTHAAKMKIRHRNDDREWGERKEIPQMDHVFQNLWNPTPSHAEWVRRSIFYRQYREREREREKV